MNSPFFHHILKVGFDSLSAQLQTIIKFPLLTRLYMPSANARWAQPVHSAGNKASGPYPSFLWHFRTRGDIHIKFGLHGVYTVKRAVLSLFGTEFLKLRLCISGNPSCSSRSESHDKTADAFAARGFSK
jgi:hypothetical protein